MTKLTLTIMICLVLILSSLAGCYGTEARTQPVASPESPSPERDYVPSSGAPSRLPDGKLEILSHRMVSEDGTITVVGVAENTGTASLSYVEVIARFYDAQGKVVEEEACTLCGVTPQADWRALKIDGLKPAETWKFEILFLGASPEKVKSYEVFPGVIR